MEGAAKAVQEMGMRAVMGPVFIDLHDREMMEREIKKQERFFRFLGNMKSKRITGCVNPHAVYTVSKEGLEWCREFSERLNLPVHIHLSETKRENEDFFKKTGRFPVDYLEDIGLLSERLIAAHCVWLSHGDIEKLAKYGVKVAYNPVSNMKLSVGRIMPYQHMLNSGVTVSLGTDGCASNNNLDMFESMKFASIVQKYSVNETTAPAEEVFKLATENGAKTLGINAGVIEEGRLADIILIDLKRPEMIPIHNLASNLVFSANGSCVDTTIVDGKILMENRKVHGEEEILERAGEFARRLVEEER